MIDTITNRKNLYEDIRPKPGEDFSGKGTGWIHSNQPEDRSIRCDLYFNFLFPLFRHISSRCRECYKVVVKPQIVYDLFTLYDIQRSLPYHSKCGIANRVSDDGMYAGFFYCRGLEEGKRRYKIVRAIFNDDTPVTLKRYCTEFEIGATGIGPSDQIPPLTKEQKDFEDYVSTYYIGPERFTEPQDDNTVRSVMLRWLYFARRHGDMTYKEFTNGVDLYEKAVTYHGE